MTNREAARRALPDQRRLHRFAGLALRVTRGRAPLDSFNSDGVATVLGR